ncbi:MAG: hypothetical protein MZU79_01225 [Anaerotruncus sp.]|nr:hypothetical protein [Anaerotruncus sp.]
MPHPAAPSEVRTRYRTASRCAHADTAATPSTAVKTSSSTLQSRVESWRTGIGAESPELEMAARVGPVQNYIEPR